MRHTNSVFHDLLKLVPWATFDRLVGEFGADGSVRSFTRRNQFQALLFAQLGGASSLREVEAVMASHLDAPAREIADLYKRRWQIELFFRVMMKQTLKINKFLGRSENAVRIQIAVALIAFLLLRLLQELTQEKHGFLELVRLVRANLMHRKDVSRLHKNVPTPIDSRQLELNRVTT